MATLDQTTKDLYRGQILQKAYQTIREISGLQVNEIVYKDKITQAVSDAIDAVVTAAA